MSTFRSSISILISLFAGTFWAYATVSAHALQPGYLELRLINTDQYAVVWKTPANGPRPMSISAHLPPHCETPSPGQQRWDGRAYLARWTTNCPGGVEGGDIHISGLDQTSTDVLVRLELADEINISRRLTPDETSFRIPSRPENIEVVKTYLLYGIEHILSGIDHLLFVLALLLLVKGKARIIATVTAFTLAHSITLAGSTLGLINVPAPPIESTIALSIVFIAVEIIHSRRGKAGVTERYPWVVAFTFGLLHGFGFAGALAEAGLPQQSIPVALLFFNIGVETGQLMFIALIFAILSGTRLITRHINLRLPPWAWQIPPYIIGSLAAFWVIQRSVAF